MYEGTVRVNRGAGQSAHSRPGIGKAEILFRFGLLVLLTGFSGLNVPGQTTQDVDWSVPERYGEQSRQAISFCDRHAQGWLARPT